MTIQIKPFFDPNTSTISYILTDPSTSKAAIIDSVLDYDQYSGKISTKSADILIEYIKERKLTLEWILETHIHADHLTASSYIKEQLGGKSAIGSGIKKVLETWVPILNIAHDTAINGSQFDKLLEHNEIFYIGAIAVQTIHTPGHTPACVSYLVEDNIFVGDTLFMTDIGTARTDFPGGSAEMLYDSIQSIFNLPAKTRIFFCHDYPTESRPETFCSSVMEQKQSNKLIGDNISKADYIKARTNRDQTLSVPKLLWPSIQVNLRAGKLGATEANGAHYIKVPIKFA